MSALPARATAADTARLAKVTKLLPAILQLLELGSLEEIIWLAGDSFDSVDWLRLAVGVSIATGALEKWLCIVRQPVPYAVGSSGWTFSSGSNSTNAQNMSSIVATCTQALESYALPPSATLHMCRSVVRILVASITEPGSRLDTSKRFDLYDSLTHVVVLLGLAHRLSMRAGLNYSIWREEHVVKNTLTYLAKLDRSGLTDPQLLQFMQRAAVLTVAACIRTSEPVPDFLLQWVPAFFGEPNGAQVDWKGFHAVFGGQDFRHVGFCIGCGRVVSRETTGGAKEINLFQHCA